MANKFQFKIVTGATVAACQQKYNNWRDATPTSKIDDYTFYLFDKGGIGYLGRTQLFGSGALDFEIVSSNLAASDLKVGHMYFVNNSSGITITDKVTSATAKNACNGSIWIAKAGTVSGDIVTEELSKQAFTTYISEWFTNNVLLSTGVLSATLDDTKLLSAAAVEALIDDAVGDAVNIGFLRKVAPTTVTLTSADITAGEVSVTIDGTTYTADLDVSGGSPRDAEGDVGLVFVFQVGETYDTTDNDGDEAIFVNLKNLIDTYTFASSDNTAVVTTNNHAIDIKVNKATGTTAEQYYDMINEAIDIVLDHANDPTTYPDDYDPTDSGSGGHNLSNNKFITESQLIDILAHTLSRFVTYGGGAGMAEEEEEIG